jgi:hypothetical protein
VWLVRLVVALFDVSDVLALVFLDVVSSALVFLSKVSKPEELVSLELVQVWLELVQVWLELVPV